LVKFWFASDKKVGDLNYLMTVVAAALVRSDGCILMQKRRAGTSLAGLWEFPGGKIDPGESPEAALVRELQEELGIAVGSDTMEAVSFASAPLTGRHLVLLLYICRTWDGDPQPLDADAIAWVEPSQLLALDMPPADVPLAHALLKLLGV
jgi:8-oxo-dGTP diphosphatase